MLLILLLHIKYFFSVKKKHWRDCHCNFKWPTIFILEHVRIRFTTVPLNLWLSDENDEDILVFISEEWFFLKMSFTEIWNSLFIKETTTENNQSWNKKSWISLSHFIRTRHSLNEGWLEITLTVPLNARKSYLCSTTDTDNCFPFSVLHIHPRLNITG